MMVSGIASLTNDPPAAERGHSSASGGVDYSDMGNRRRSFKVNPMASIHLSLYEAEEGDLPNVCMRCGAPATERDRRRFVSHPVWVYALLPFGYIPYVVVAAVLTERVRCYTLFCPRHKHHWGVRTLIIIGAFLALMAFIIGSMILVGSLHGHVNKGTEEFLSGLVCFGAPVLVLCLLISIPIIQLTAIHPSNPTRDGLTLNGVSPAFVEAVHDYRENRAEEETS